MTATELAALSATLKPCPFCAGPPKLEPLPGSRDWWKVQCKDHHCGGRNWGMETAEAAAAAWNRRSGGQE